jgi:regulator of protease activity HflC (stomatin/prohibitin superfamily)
MPYWTLASAVAVLGVLLVFVMIVVKRITVFEYEKGLQYTHGKFKRVLEPGQYWYFSFSSRIQKADVRPSFVTISGQEVLSSDGVTLKTSIAAKYEIADPGFAINKVASYQEALYLELQLVLREIVGTTTIDNLLENRAEISKKLLELGEKKAQELGLRLISVNLKDLMFPGQLKEIFAQVVKARHEGLAALERARGETAALRNLANAAKMIEANPNLMQLRLLQSIGTSSGNSVILGTPPQNMMTVPIKAKEIAPATAKESKQEVPNAS